jgi:hypothetical protein
VTGALAGLAGVSVAVGDDLRATRLLGAAAALGETVDAVFPVHHERYERALAATRAGLDDAAFAAAWAAGRALSPEGIAALVAEFSRIRE